jgi:hypothetical protein
VKTKLKKDFSGNNELKIHFFSFGSEIMSIRRARDHTSRKDEIATNYLFLISFNEKRCAEKLLHQPKQQSNEKNIRRHCLQNIERSIDRTEERRESARNSNLCLFRCQPLLIPVPTVAEEISTLITSKLSLEDGTLADPQHTRSELGPPHHDEHREADGHQA